jgi:hypothetical protein
LFEFILVNVGGSSRNDKPSSPAMFLVSVGVTIVCAGQRIDQESSSPSGARMRSAVSKSGGNASLAEESERYGK